MYDKHVICDGSLRNVKRDGEVVGFALDARLPYYRGQPLSIVEDIVVKVDGEAVDRSAVRLSLRGRTWSLDALEPETHERWEFGEVATVSVLQPGGLASGGHAVTVAEHLRISYLPWPSVTTCTKTLVVAD